MEEIIKNNFQESEQILKKFISQSENFTKIASASKKMVEAINKGGKIISCGNGGSMADAMHFAEELTGRFRNDRKPLPAISISDPTHISCTCNDYGYNHVFSRFVQAIALPGDVLLAISTSGNSENVVNAALEAKTKNVFIIALTGKDGGKLASLADLEIRVPHFGFADRIQEIHIKIIHSLIHSIELLIENNNEKSN